MRIVPVLANISGGTPDQFRTGSDFGFRILRTTGAGGSLAIPGSGSVTAINANGVPASDFLTTGPGIMPVVIEINREQDAKSSQGLDLTTNPIGGSSTLLVTDGAWQKVPCRQIRISNLQPFNFFGTGAIGETSGQYTFVFADSPQEMEGEVLRLGFADDCQFATTSEFLATSAGATAPTLIQGRFGSGGTVSNFVAGLSKLVIQNLGPNIVYVAMRNWRDIGNAFTTNTLTIAGGIALAPAAAGVPAPAGTLILEGLGDGLSAVIATITADQVAAGGTRVMKFFGPGYRGGM